MLNPTLHPDLFTQDYSRCMASTWICKVANLGDAGSLQSIRSLQINSWHLGRIPTTITLLFGLGLHSDCCPWQSMPVSASSLTQDIQRQPWRGDSISGIGHQSRPPPANGPGRLSSVLVKSIF